jgi:hypothetical protein
MNFKFIDFDAVFFSVTTRVLFAVLKIINYMEIKIQIIMLLVRVLCQTVSKFLFVHGIIYKVLFYLP